MLNYKLKIGLIPMRRDIEDGKKRKGIFEPGKAEERCRASVKYIKEKFTDDITEFVDLDWLNDEAMLIRTDECEQVRDYLVKEEVNAIFIINCNFGNEEAAGTIAKMMQLPTLLWGPQDTVFESNGVRYTDSQCGLFAISNQFRHLKVPFSYIENCRIEDEVFTNGLQRFLSVATMVNNFKKLRITQVGTRLNPFKSVMVNELELTERFGFNMQTVNMAVVADKFPKIYDKMSDLLDADVAKLKTQYDVKDFSDEDLKKMLTFVYLYIEIFNETKADVLTSECWTSMPLAFGTNPCLAMSILYDMGYIVACESDVYGAISSALLTCAARGKNASMFGEFTVRHPENKNAELLWHCGPFPYSMKKDGIQAELFNGKPSFRAKDGRYTIARFQGDGGKYTLLGGNFDSTEGPHTFGTHVWAQFKDLSAIEKKLINGPYIHHMSEIYGDYNEVLEEFCKYVDGLEFDPIEE